jgi:hypothetical protein
MRIHKNCAVLFNFNRIERTIMMRCLILIYYGMMYVVSLPEDDPRYGPKHVAVIK